MDPFEIPEDIGQVQDLAAAREQAREAYRTERDAESPDVERLSALADFVDAASAELTARADREQALADLDGRMTASDDPDDDGEPAADQAAADDGSPAGDDDAPEGDAPDAAQSASADRTVRTRRPSIGDLAAQGDPGTPDVAAARHTPTGRLTASVNTEGFRTGDEITMRDIGRIATERIEALARMGRSSEVRQTAQLATLRRDFPDDLSSDVENVERLIEFASSVERIPGGRLLPKTFDAQTETFAGGWCAPSETLYDRFCPAASLDGMWSSPEINARRGGVRWPVSPDFCEVYNNPGFVVVTEAMDEAGFVKPCIEVPCPEFQEERLDAVPLCLIGGLLQNAAFPESVANYVSNVLAAHAHYMNAQKLFRLEAGSGTLVTIPANFGAASQLLDAVGLAVQDLRDAYRLPENELLEVVLPLWSREVIRADVGRRNGQVALDVTDAQINAWFARRGAVVQWVYDWQPLGDAGLESPGDSPSEDCPPTPQTAFPTSVRFVIYRAGTWVTATTDVINLNTFYDSTLLSTNKYGIQFSETGFALMNNCPGSRVYSTSICADGSTGGTDELACSTQPIT